jgi:hypothetical protein
MSTREQLNSYIGQLQRRLRLGALLRGAAILTSAALAATVILVLISNAFAFSQGSITGARIALFIALAFAVGFGLALPLYGLSPRRAAGRAEGIFPEFQQRLVTFSERDTAAREPFVELLAADTLEVARNADPARLVPDRKLLAFLAAGAASLGILIWMIAAGPGYLGHGAALLWMGAPRGAAPFYDLRVSPGDATVRRNSNQMVTAQVSGLQTDRVQLYARYQSASKWQQVTMQPQAGGSGFQFLLAGLPENVEYYVDAGPLRSRHFHIRVVDLPAVKQIRVTYHYPAWTGLKDVVNERSGDLSALEGTDAGLEVLMDRPLRNGELVINDHQQVQLSGGAGNLYRGTIHIDKNGAYHVAALDNGQAVRLSNDYFIDAQKANPPTIRINRPGNDYRASPIEEVSVSVHADDAFGLKGVGLHYSVNGGPEKTINMLPHPGAKDADGSTVLSLENFKLVPGDVVSLYATAKDAHADSHTDIYFIEAQPFEREYSQSQTMGGGGGGMGGQGNQFEISQRQKEIIAATWKQQGNKSASPRAAAESGKFLSGVQAKLRDQALSLAGRLQRRELTQQNQEFSSFQNDMNAAAGAMGPAAQRLGQLKWEQALPSEQKALQYLLRAEATFRQIEVAFGSRGGGGGGGGAGRDLQSLFDLELDTEKNQYETQQTAASANQQRSQQIDEALQKLDQLARRQQQLAQQQPNSVQSLQQRWQQEMLRRQAEQLQRQLEQMFQTNQLSAQQGSSASSGQAGSGQSQASQRIEQTLQRLRQANDDMRRAASGQASADAQQAADQLRQATNLLGGMRQQQASQQLDSVARETQQLASQQREQADRIHRMFGQGDDGANANPQEEEKLARDRVQTAEDLAQLEKRIQDAIRNLASGDQAAAAKLRDALGNAQQSDLQLRLQRSADWIRRGMGSYSALNEPGITSDMQQLADQVHQAQQAFGNSQQGPGGQQQELESALNRIDRLRNQVDALSRDYTGRNAAGQAGQRGQIGQQGQNGNAGGIAGGPYGNGRYGGPYGGYNGPWNGYRGPYTGQMPPPYGVRPDQAIPPERLYQETLRELNALRQAMRGQPEPLADLEELMREMQRYNPSSYPGNPAVIEQLHNQVLATMDKVELQLRRQLDNAQPGQIRSGDSQTVPQGYADSVADYFRRLSKNQGQNNKN